jgi:hypothetical protein
MLMETVDADVLAGQNVTMAGRYDTPAMLDKDGKELYDPFEDRDFPGESVENDTVFAVLVAVVLDPAPAPKKTGE